MNSARTLYSILNVIILLLLTAIGLGVFFFATALFGIEQDLVGIKEDVSEFKSENIFYMIIILMIGVYAIFIASIWKLREVTKLLLKKDFYNNKLIQALFNSGKLMLISGVASWTIHGISNLFFKFKAIIGLSEKTLVYLFIIAIGLFFMLISTVLKEAKAIKQENDLTI